MPLQHTPEFIASFEEAALLTVAFLQYRHLGQQHFDPAALIAEIEQNDGDHISEEHRHRILSMHNRSGEVLFTNPALTKQSEVKLWDNQFRHHAFDHLLYAKMRATNLGDLFNPPEHMLPIQQRQNFRRPALMMAVDFSLSAEQQKAIQEEKRREHNEKWDARWAANVDPLETEKQALAKTLETTTDGRTAFYMTLRTLVENEKNQRNEKPEKSERDDILIMYAEWFLRYLDQKIEGKKDAECLPLEIGTPEMLNRFKAMIDPGTDAKPPSPAPGQYI